VTVSPRVNIKVSWGFEKDISLHVWGSATFNYLCLRRLMGILHPQTPTSSNTKGWDRPWLPVELGTPWAASPSPNGSVHESAQPVLGLTLNCLFQPEGKRALQLRRKSRLPLALQHISHGVVLLLCLKCKARPSASAHQRGLDAFQQQC